MRPNIKQQPNLGDVGAHKSLAKGRRSYKGHISISSLFLESPSAMVALSAIGRRHDISADNFDTVERDAPARLRLGTALACFPAPRAPFGCRSR